MSEIDVIRIASAQYNISQFQSSLEFEAKLKQWVEEATVMQADILLFPEYGAMELTSLFDSRVQQDLQQQIAVMQELLSWYVESYQNVARQYRRIIVASSFPVKENEKTVNRSFVFFPDGSYAFQDKLQMTRFEKEQWNIQGGKHQIVFQGDNFTFAVCLCYDIEFPIITRKLAESGAQIILVPSCTDSESGYHRVKIACQARALENQCAVIQAPTVGDAAWSRATDTNYGAAGFFVPPDTGLPANGILALGEINQAKWLIEDIDLNQLSRVRNDGQVLNHQDWSSQLSLSHSPKKYFF